MLITWQKVEEPTPSARSAWTYRYEVLQQDGKWMLKSVVLRPEP
jgi:hypothetical protein